MLVVVALVLLVSTGFAGIVIIDTEYEFTIGFLSTIEIGSPPQSITAQWDTGSSDLLVNSVTNPQCVQDICEFGAFASNESITYSNLTDPKNLHVQFSFASGSQVDDKLVSDTIFVDSKKIPRFNFALVSNGDLYGDNIFGIGPRGNQGTFDSNGSPAFYDSFPYHLKALGLIKRLAYSFYSGPTQGKVIFGGVDHGKYDGCLEKLHVVHDNAFYTLLEAIDADDVSILDEQIHVLFDTGTALTLFPSFIAEKLAEFLKATYSEEYNTFVVPCDQELDFEYLHFAFQNMELSVRFKDLFLIIEDNVCAVGFDQGATEDKIIFGSSLLRNYYTLYDLDSKEILIANVNSDGPNNIEILSGPVQRTCDEKSINSTSIWSSTSTESTIETTTLTSNPSTSQTRYSTSSVGPHNSSNSLGELSSSSIIFSEHYSTTLTVSNFSSSEDKLATPTVTNQPYQSNKTATIVTDVHSATYSTTHPLTHSFTHSFTHSIIPSAIHSTTHCCNGSRTSLGYTSTKETSVKIPCGQISSPTVPYIASKKTSKYESLNSTSTVNTIEKNNSNTVRPRKRQTFFSETSPTTRLYSSTTTQAYLLSTTTTSISQRSIEASSNAGGRNTSKTLLTFIILYIF
ncbi:BA75_03650T0 [Komagataella pastoris]|uniref:BA75_03650T0 n=1 Tax=Komagataella pastoris TaxID=4922 RepID=A0A1B2JEY0_PICPA|nr:BA75_03650T0 [Komagataella pastoris]